MPARPPGLRIRLALVAPLALARPRRGQPIAARDLMLVLLLALVGVAWFVAGDGPTHLQLGARRLPLCALVLANQSQARRAVRREIDDCMSRSSQLAVPDRLHLVVAERQRNAPPIASHIHQDV